MSVSESDWLYSADQDLQVARLVVREGLFAIACFHAQQCAEKSVKAATLAATGQAPFIMQSL